MTDPNRPQSDPDDPGPVPGGPRSFCNGPRPRPDLTLSDDLWLHVMSLAAEAWTDDEREQVATAIEAGERMEIFFSDDPAGRTWMHVVLRCTEIARLDVRALAIPDDPSELVE